VRAGSIPMSSSASASARACPSGPERCSAPFGFSVGENDFY